MVPYLGLSPDGKRSGSPKGHSFSQAHANISKGENGRCLNKYFQSISIVTTVVIVSNSITVPSCVILKDYFVKKIVYDY